MNPGSDIKYHSGIKLLSDAIKWKSVRKALVKRIQTVCKGGFSVRDIKRLKKELKSLRPKGEIDYEALIYNYPGKPLNQFKDLCEEILERMDKKTLSQLNSVDKI